MRSIGLWTRVCAKGGGEQLPIGHMHMLAHMGTQIASFPPGTTHNKHILMYMIETGTLGCVMNICMLAVSVSEFAESTIYSVNHSLPSADGRFCGMKQDWNKGCIAAYKD